MQYEINKHSRVYDILPKHPRLSGILHYGPPFSWKVNIDEHGVQLIVDSAGLDRLRRFFIYLAMMTLFVTFLVTWRMDLADSLINSVLIALVPCIGLCAAAIGVNYWKMNEVRRGPIFKFDRTLAQFDLPRHQMSFNCGQVIRWDIVFGCWVQSKFRNARKWGDDISELQLVIQEDDRQFAVPLIGGLGRNSLNSVAKTIASITKLPLERVDEPRSIRNPFSIN